MHHKQCRSNQLKYLIASTIIAASLVSAVSPAQARTTRERCEIATPAQVESLYTGFSASWATKNPQNVTSLFTPDAVLLATVSNVPRTTPAAINDYFVSFLKNSPVGTIDTSTISIGCNIASRVGTWTVALTNPTTNAVTNVKARYSFIYKYGPGGWKIYHLHSSMMPEPTS
jgi:uncharacterized protein (TIGR02246 family)